MLRPGSYFPPADCWSSRLPSPEVPAPAPLLPTPIPTALPSTLGGTLNEQPPDLDVDLPLSHPPPCSCPVNDTCIAEYLALLLGSFKLLHQILLALQEPDDGSSQHDTTTLKATFCATATALSKFETSVKKILESLLDSEEFGLSELLLQQWRRPIEPLPEEEDICFSIRRKIDGLLINVVDTFPPIQHNLHMLLVRYEFGSSRLQTMLQELQVSLRWVNRIQLCEVLTLGVESECWTRDQVAIGGQSTACAVLGQVGSYTQGVASQRS